MISEAKRKADEKWRKKAYFTTLIRFRKEREEEIRKYAGGNLNGFIVSAVMEKIEKMKLENKDH